MLLASQAAALRVKVVHVLRPSLVVRLSRAKRTHQHTETETHTEHAAYTDRQKCAQKHPLAYKEITTSFSFLLASSFIIGYTVSPILEIRDSSTSQLGATQSLSPT